MDGAPVGGRGEGQAFGLATGREPQVHLRARMSWKDPSAAAMTELSLELWEH